MGTCQKDESVETISVAMDREVQVLFATEQHLVMAKLLRRNADVGSPLLRKRRIEMSNSFLVCARLAAVQRGGICLNAVEWFSVDPGWSTIDHQVQRLAPPDLEG